MDFGGFILFGKYSNDKINESSSFELNMYMESLKMSKTLASTTNHN